MAPRVQHTRRSNTHALLSRFQIVSTAVMACIPRRLYTSTEVCSHSPVSDATITYNCRCHRVRHLDNMDMSQPD
jgi:hypothetical protein